MNFGVCVLIMNSAGKILAVSRTEDISLPGGEIKPGETPIAAAYRELLEKTGYKVLSPGFSQLIYHSDIEGKLTVTYQIDHSAIEQVNIWEGTHFVTWVNPESLGATKNKAFGRYNRDLFRAIGIKYSSQGAEKSDTNYLYKAKF